MLRKENIIFGEWQQNILNSGPFQIISPSTKQCEILLIDFKRQTFRRKTRPIPPRRVPSGSLYFYTTCNERSPCSQPYSLSCQVTLINGIRQIIIKEVQNRIDELFGFFLIKIFGLKICCKSSISWSTNGFPAPAFSAFSLCT